VLSLGACDVVFVACECELLPHACSAGDAARVVCTQVSKHFSSRRNSESLTDSKLTYIGPYIAYFWEMCGDVCIDDDLNASRSAGMELYLLSFGKHGGFEAAELADED
jgi:hypothetical protein